MGLPNFLMHVLESAGRPIDLSNYDTLRIAIDASAFIYQACQFNGNILADERHLSAFGRATLLFQEQQKQQQQPAEVGDDAVAGEAAVTAAATKVRTRDDDDKVQEFVTKCCADVMHKVQDLQQHAEQVLVVLDGRTPPIKANTTAKRRQDRAFEETERDRGVTVTTAVHYDNDNDDNTNIHLERRLRANRRAGAGNQHFGTVVDAIVATLRSHCVPFLVAPYEADGQLAFLQQRGYVDLVITEDSDLIAYNSCGGNKTAPILYKLSRRPVDGRWTRGVLLRGDDINGTSTWTKPARMNFADFSPAMMACVFAASGCDYCPSLRGIGSVGAVDMVREAFLLRDSNTNNSNNINNTPPLGRLLDMILERAWDRRNMTDPEKQHFRDGFIAGVFMFRHCLVYDPVRGVCRSLTKTPDEELTMYEPYRELCDNLERQKRDIVGECLPSPLVTHMAEGWICPKTLRPRTTLNEPFPTAQVQADLNEYWNHRSKENDKDDDGGDNDEIDNDRDENDDQESGGDRAPNPESQNSSTRWRPISVREARMSVTKDAPTTRDASLPTTKRNAETIPVGTRALKRAARDQTCSSPRTKALDHSCEEDKHHDVEDTSSSADSLNEPESQRHDCVIDR